LNFNILLPFIPKRQILAQNWQIQAKMLKPESFFFTFIIQLLTTSEANGKIYFSAVHCLRPKISPETLIFPQGLK